MILADVNVLLYAFRSDLQEHSDHKLWLDTVINGATAYAMSTQVLGALARIATNPRIFRQPSPVGEVLDFARKLIDQPHCRIVQPGPRHWMLFSELCLRVKAAGNLVQDAWFAALAIEHDCEWITNDRDYGRFEGLHWRTPF